MPNITSAKKALRQSERRHAQNAQKLRALREAVKEVRKYIAAGKKDAAAAILPKAYQALDKAAKMNVLKKNTVSRKKARLTRAVAKTT